jgi:hypothetical protein
MKTAVLITGKLDYFKETYNNINDRLLSFLGDYDVFVSTWDLPEQDKTDLISVYNPKVLDIEQFNENTKYLIHNHSDYQKSLDREIKYGSRNSLYMWYKINRGLNLIKEYSLFNNVEYDLIIRFRTDFFFTNRLDFDSINQALNKIIIVGPHVDHHSWRGGTPHASDNFFIVHKDHINTFSHLYFNYTNIWNTGEYISPEHLYYSYLKDSNINFLQTNLKFGRIHEDVCILWTPKNQTVKGRSMEEILALKNNFELDNDHNLIIYS